MPFPYGIRVDDGFSTIITFGRAPTISLWEKEVTPFGLDSGGPVPTETMRNTLYRTMNAKHLITATPFNIVAAYNSGVIDDIQNQLGKNQLFTITYPNGDLLLIWAFLDKFIPNAHKEGEQPTAQVTFQPTNLNDLNQETPPSYVNAAPNTPYASLGIGAPPSMKTLAFFSWKNNYEQIRLANVPLSRLTKYYFSQSGDDTTGNGSEALPWKSVPKAQTTINAATSPANMQLLFKRGDVWRDLAILTVNKTHITISDYGNPSLAKPIFTRFTRQYPAGAAWTADTPPRYKLTETGSIGWLRDANDILAPYMERTTAAGVLATAFSFYHETGTNTLYVNAGGGAGPNAIDFEYAPLDAIGWVVSKDNVRLENIILHGMGMHINTAAGYGLQVIHSDDTIFEECVLVRVEVLYAGYHAIGHIGNNKTLGESLTMIECKAGYCTDRFTGGIHDMNPYVSFATLGEQELYMRACEVSAGMLPSVGWAAVVGSRGGSFGVNQHTQDAVHFAALSIVEDTLYPDVDWQCPKTTSLNCPPWVTTEETELRAYVIDERPAAPGVAIPLAWGTKDKCQINCAYNFTGTRKLAAGTEYLWGMVVAVDDFDGLAVNCKLNVDASIIAGVFGGGSALYNALTETAHLRMENCRLEVTGVTTATAIYMIFQTDSSLMGARIKIRNSIITFSVAAGVNVGTGLGSGLLTADPDNANQLTKAGTNRIVNNAYFLGHGGGIYTPPSDYLDADAGRVVSLTAIPDVIPQGGNVLFHTGAVNGLEYDFNRNPRNMPAPTIGPLE